VKLLKVWYQPKVEVEFSWSDVEGMILFSEQHYDPTCKALSQPGGDLYGMRNKFNLPLRTGGADDLAVRRMATITWTVDESLAGLLVKCVESDPSMVYRMMPIVKKLGTEWRRLNRGNR